MSSLFAVEDGIWSGNIDTADLFFLLSTILAVVAAVLYAMATRPVVAHGDHVHRNNISVWAPVAGWLALACLAFGWLVL